MRLLSTKIFEKRFILFLHLVFFVASNLGAQVPGYHFINFSNRDGLSSNSINTILKDKYGYMWFGTEDGLNKFDGSNFKVYRHNTADATSIGDNHVTTMYEDNSGNLWVGTDRSLSLYDRKRDAFINYDFFKDKVVRSIAVDTEGNLWVGSYYGLFYYNPKKGITRHYLVDAANNCQLKSNDVIHVFIDNRQQIWVGTTAGLHLYSKNDDSFISYQHVEGDETSIAGNMVRSINQDAKGSIWVGTDGGLSQLQPDGKSFKSFCHHDDKNSLSSDDVYTVTPDVDGKLWIGTERGLSIFDQSSGSCTRIAHDPRNKYSLTGKSVRSIYIDKNGIYWIGAYQGGVNKYDKNLAFFYLKQSNPLDPFGLSSPVVTSFVESPSGDLYVGTDGGGLNLYNRKTGLFDHLSLNADGKQNLPILTMERVGNEVWVGTYQDGLYALDMTSGAVKHYNSGTSQKTLSSNDIFCIKKDSRGQVWIGTNGGGVNVFDPTTKTFTRLYNAHPDLQFLSSGFIRTIDEDGAGKIWIGTHGAGVAAYDPVRKTFQVFNQINSKLPSNIVLSIRPSKNGELWVGTLGGGLSRYDKKTASFVSFSEDDGLSNAVIYKILEDDLGKLWVSTNKGISCFDKTNQQFKNYSFQNGVQHSTFNLGAGIKTTTGELFFGGLDGFNFFDPRTLHSNKNVPALVFTDLKISNRTVVPGDQSVIKDHISIAKEIRLDYKQNFSLDFAALNYTAPLENKYSYKLEGFDKEWNEVGAAHSAVYTNLDPGEYTFRVKAYSDDGLWSTPEKSIKIYVKPPLWRTAYAYFFYIIIAASIIVSIRYRGIRKVKNKFALERERLMFKQMIEEEKRERDRQHEFDELKIKFLTNLSHEFRTPISLIVGPVEKMIVDEPNKEKREQLGLVKRNARRLLNLVNQLLDFRKLEENESKLHLAEGDIVACIKDVADSFKDVSESKHIRFNFSSALGYCHTMFDQDKIERILFNLLSNAFKFTGKGGEIRVRLEQESTEKLKIVVSDTGIGMTQEEKLKVFDRFFQGNIQADILNQGSGIGLSIAREFVKLHGGTIELESEPGKGSVFTVLLPYQAIDQTVNDATENLSDAVGIVKPTKETASANDIHEHEKLTVLLVEDNDDFRQYLRDNLKPFYKIVEASDGKEGWQKALSSHPQVIVSDINMPGMDGIMLSRKLKSDKRTMHIPILLLTALTGDSNQLRGLSTGANDYLTKPFNFEILNARIKNLIALNQSLKTTYSKQLKIGPAEIEVKSEDEQLMLKVIQFIEANIDSPDLSVEELSKHVFMSRGSLYTKIVNLTGETPVEFIRSVKLNKAIALLENSDKKIAEIAYAVGFSTPNYFARAFKAKFNISPSEYINLKKAEVTKTGGPWREEY